MATKPEDKIVLANDPSAAQQADLSAITLDSSVGRDEFLNAMRLVPGAVAIIATVHKGKRGGLAATSWDSLTADPPTVLACVNESASAHDMIVAAKRFSISLLPQGHEETVAIFSKKKGLEGDARFLPEQWRTGPMGLPILGEAVIALECSLVGLQKVGTHSVLFGEVRSHAIRPNAAPLLYMRGDFARAEMTGYDWRASCQH